MPIDQSFVGREYPPTEPYEVGREHIREFARAVGETSPICHDLAAAQAAGYRDLVAPTTFPIVVTFRASRQAINDPDLGLDYSRVVHGEQEFRYQRPVQAGDRLQAVVSIESIRVAAGNDLITTRTEVVTADGESVVTVFSTLVARGTAA